MRLKLACIVWIATGGLTLGALPVEADDEAPNLLTEPFYVGLGSFILNSDTKIRLDGEGQRGTNLNWEDTFGIGDDTRFRIDAYWRFGDRHKVRALWFNSSRSNS